MEDTGRTVWRVGKYNAGTHGPDTIKGSANAVEIAVAGLHHRPCALKYLELGKRNLPTRGKLENRTPWVLQALKVTSRPVEIAIATFNQSRRNKEVRFALCI